MPVSFRTSLLYMSGSTFLTLGLGDVISADTLGRTFMVFEAATGFVFLGLIITYMPLLDQAYASREVGGLCSSHEPGIPRARSPSQARRYAGADRCRNPPGQFCAKASNWMAATLQSHLSHPVLCFYRAQHFGQSWLVSLTTVLDTCSLLIVGGEGQAPRAGPAHLPNGGCSCLADLASALDLKVPTHVDSATDRRRPASRSASALSSEESH